MVKSLQHSKSSQFHSTFIALQGTASVVVLFDSHWNPAVDAQCAFRICRLDQLAEKMCIRLLLENSLEDTTFKRAVNKNRLARSVIDGKASTGVFTESETDLKACDNWAQCDECKKVSRNTVSIRTPCFVETNNFFSCKTLSKWRKLPDGQDLPEHNDNWFCDYNEDVEYNSCDAPQMDGKWNAKDDQDIILEKEPLLSRIAAVKKKRTRTDKTLVSQIYSEEIFLSDMTCEEELKQMVEEQLQERVKAPKEVLAKGMYEGSAN